MLLLTCVRMAEIMIRTLNGNSLRIGSKVTESEGRQGLKYQSNKVLMAMYIRYCVASAQ